jgi:periplasmic protein TonB
MRDPFFQPLSSLASSKDSLLQRIRENFQQALGSGRVYPSSANGAPLHLLPSRPHFVASGSRTISLVAHILLISGMVFLHLQSRPPITNNAGPEAPPHGPFTFFPIPDRSHFGEPSLGVKRGGGEKDPRPARHGDLAPGSSRPLLPPRLSVNAAPELPVLTAVFDPNASQLPPLITNLGLPWMKEDSNSAGPGKDHGFGSGKKGGMGDDEGPGAGQGNSYGGPYANVVTLPTCLYCPDPQYTDEAREAKLQGKVTLRVLVGTDGRASQVQIVQGVGMGLDDRAAQSVRAWKFNPAHDAARRAVSTWVTIEVVFRLI